MVEGRKAVEEVFHSAWQVEGIWATAAFAERHSPDYSFEWMTEDENKKCTSFDTAPLLIFMLVIWNKHLHGCREMD